ncbi:MAG: hypothetical protein Q8M94_17615 [Ignavibacteria bacterium]|nr:hypothetical protein [Ignavibacteria bacterium]
MEKLLIEDLKIFYHKYQKVTLQCYKYNGEENPIADNSTTERKSKNRRVELIKK